jgi:hypothetical protein
MPLGSGGLIRPGEAGYPRALAAAFSRFDIWHLWAYANVAWVWVSFRQVAYAMGRQPTAALRQKLAGKKLAFFRESQRRYVTRIESVAEILGTEITDRILMYPYQAAKYLGVSRVAAPMIARRLGIALERDDVTVVPWGKLRRVQRLGPRTFKVVDDNFADRSGRQR